MRGDVGIDPQRGHAHIAQRTTREEIHKAEQGVVAERSGQRLTIDTRNRNMRGEPECHQEGKRKQDTEPEIRHSHRVDHGLNQGWPATFCSLGLYALNHGGSCLVLACGLLSLDHGCGAACPFDFLTCRLGEGMCGDHEGLLQITVAQDLDRVLYGVNDSG